MSDIEDANVPNHQSVPTNETFQVLIQRELAVQAQSSQTLQSQRKDSHLGLSLLGKVVCQEVQVLFPRAGNSFPEAAIFFCAVGTVDAFVEGDAELDVCFAHVGVLVVHAAYG